LSPTRQTFAGLAHWEIVFWYSLSGLSVAVFAYGVARLVRKYRRGSGQFRIPSGLLRAVLRAVRIVATHTWIRRRDTAAGAAHLAIFYGFLVLLAGTTILAIQDDIARPLFDFDFWRGDFYLGYSLFLDVFGAVLTGGLVVMAVKRGIRRPFRLDYRRVDRASEDSDRRMYRVGDWVFLGTLLFLACTGFVLEALRVAQTNPSFETWSPFGWLIGHALRGLGLGAGSAANVHFVLWWLHGVAALTFVSSIPFTKGVHLLAGPASVAARDEKALRTFAPLALDAPPEVIGFGVITDLPAKYLLQLDACTKCGKCHEACPARASGFPLSPRDLILDLREHAEGALGIRGSLGIPPLHEAGEDLFARSVRPESVWSCVQCGACVEICPVGIEHVPLINQLRRRLVERGEMDPQLQSTLETIHLSGNSVGESRRKRGRWTRDLDLEVKDARKEPVDLLWIVGDYASFDPRNQRATQALARILRHAEIDFGILYDGERNLGSDVRQVGEEGLFADLAQANLEVIGGCDFRRILTSDPHSFHALKNDYPALGAFWDVVHHSELLSELLAEGSLTPRKPLDQRVTYHDACHLGRKNGVYDAPRDVLRAIGADLAEMPRNRDNSFCCGAGGGRIWMTDIRTQPGPRPADLRIDEAVALGGVRYFVVACPKDVTMYEDAVKTSGQAGELEVRELSELVLEALEIGSGPPATLALESNE
jgi:Fe-S oxidoreductase